MWHKKSVSCLESLTSSLELPLASISSEHRYRICTGVWYSSCILAVFVVFGCSSVLLWVFVWSTERCFSVGGQVETNWSLWLLLNILWCHKGFHTVLLQGSECDYVIRCQYSPCRVTWSNLNLLKRLKKKIKSFYQTVRFLLKKKIKVQKAQPQVTLISPNMA